MLPAYAGVEWSFQILSQCTYSVWPHVLVHPSWLLFWEPRAAKLFRDFSFVGRSAKIFSLGFGSVDLGASARDFVLRGAESRESHFPCVFSVRTILWLDGGVAVLSRLEGSVGHGHELSRFLQPFPVGYNNFLHVSLPRLFTPECRVECPSYHCRHECVPPCLLVVLLSSPLLTLVPTAKSTVVFANLFVIRLRRGASENLFALSQLVLVPEYCTLPFPEKREGGRRRWGYREVQTLWARYAAINS